MKAPEYGTQYFAGLEAECLTRPVACTFCQVLRIRVQESRLRRVSPRRRNDLSIVALGGVAKMSRARRSGRLTRLLVLHPLAYETRASDDAEISTLAPYQIHKRNAIQLLEMS